MSDIGWAGLGLSGTLVAVAVGLSLWRQLGLEASILWAAARALTQLLVIGLVLEALLQPGVSSSWAWLWVAVMVVAASGTVARRAPRVPGLFGLALAAFATSAVLTLGVLFGFGVFTLSVRTIVPLAGLMIGNSMAATVLVARRLVDELGDKRDEVEARLALGQPAEEAARPYVRSALRTALTPQIETTKIVGLIALPGSMTGLILAGVDPFNAVRVQAAVMYLILGSVAATTTVVALGMRRRLFTADHRLTRLVASRG
ncbi:MAG TPA: iron export ABC transporter permease subunit FetB [Acidimicrobiia bacterium]|nr:iron export ABC transporter permease subunit FetB [Acidimicrobiia bacterium]